LLVLLDTAALSERGMDFPDKPERSPENGKAWHPGAWLLVLIVAFSLLAICSGVGGGLGVQGFFAGHLSENYRNLNKEGPTIEGPVFSGDSRRVAFSVCSHRCEIRIVEIASGSSSTFAHNEQESRANGAKLESYRHPSFHPDGKHIVLSRYRQQGKSTNGFEGDTYSISVATFDGVIVRDAFRSSTRKSHPLMLGDGERVIFASSDPPEGDKAPASAELMLGDMRSGSLRPLQGAQRAWQLVPKRTTGDTLEFWAYRMKQSPFEEGGLFQMDIKNGQWKGLKGDTATSSNFVPLPDGNWVHLQRTNDIDGNRGSYVYDIFMRSKLGDSRITHAGVYMKHLAASPDGGHFAVVGKSVAAKREYLAVYSADGREILRINP
jgi:Tol biopolymer transport system component